MSGKEIYLGEEGAADNVSEVFAEFEAPKTPSDHPPDIAAALGEFVNFSDRLTIQAPPPVEEVEDTDEKPAIPVTAVRALIKAVTDGEITVAATPGGDIPQTVPVSALNAPTIPVPPRPGHDDPTDKDSQPPVIDPWGRRK